MTKSHTETKPGDRLVTRFGSRCVAICAVLDESGFEWITVRRISDGVIREWSLGADLSPWVEENHGPWLEGPVL